MAVYKAKANFQNVQPKFKIFYENGTTYTDKSGPIDRAHKQGVVTILIETNFGQRLEKKHAFYYYGRDGWTGTNQSGMFNYLCESGYKLVLFGSDLNDDKRKTIYDSALSDTYIKGK